MASLVASTGGSLALGGLVLMFGTGCTSPAQKLNVIIDVKPVHYRLGKLLHPLHTKMSQVYEL